LSNYEGGNIGIVVKYFTHEVLKQTTISPAIKKLYIEAAL
jgi:hypothetical protein